MAEVMVSVSAGVINSLLAKLSSLLENEYKLLKGVKDEITFLRDEMSSMKALLLKLAEMEKLDVQQKEWRDKVRELVYDIEDRVDIFMQQLGHGDASAGFMGKMAHQLKTLGARHHIGKQIQELKARIMDESERRNRYVFDKHQAEPEQASIVAIDPRQLPAADLIGIDGPRKKILKLLKKEEEGAQPLKVVSIVGLAGVGKTSIANQVYMDIRDQFDCTAFVSVSPKPNIARTLMDILSAIEFCSEGILNDERKLIHRIRERLEHKSYLIVIDDIWNIQAWDIIRYTFVENNKGSRVITTTRNEHIATMCCSHFNDHVCKIKSLSDLDSRRLFFRKIFGSEDACPEQFRKVSVEILKKCEGLPLAIVSVSRILASQPMLVEKWEKTRNSLSFELETNPTLGLVQHALNLSYIDLSLDIRTCVLYLAVFPKDFVIWKDHLVKRWTAEGFVSDIPGCDPEEVADRYFFELMSRGMIQPVDYDDCGEVISCRVHGLMLDLIMSKSKEENFITMIDDQQCSKTSFKVRRASLDVKNTECHRVLATMDLSHARSLTFWGPIHRLPPLSKFQLLRVLHLEVSPLNHSIYDLTVICSFFQLRYLRIIGLRCNLPTNIRALKYLETLETDQRENFPADVWELSSLLRLIVPLNLELPDGIGKMRALRTLQGFYVNQSCMENIKQLGELSNLRELHIYCDDLMRDATPFLVSSLGKLGRNNLRSLIFRSSSSPRFAHCDLLSCWSPPPRLLHRLHVRGCTFSRVPEWIRQLDRLTSLEVDVQVLSKDGVDVLAMLPSLFHLRLHVETHTEERVFMCSTAFPNLKEFWFGCPVPSLMFEPGAMPKLQSLYVQLDADRVAQANSLLVGIEHLPRLEQFWAHVYNSSGSPIHAYQMPGPWRKQQFFSMRRSGFGEYYLRIKNAEAALRKAINKHPGSPSIIIDRR